MALRSCAPTILLAVVTHDEQRQPGAEPVPSRAAHSGRSCGPWRTRPRHGLDALDGLGIVVPHRAQRARSQQAFPRNSCRHRPDQRTSGKVSHRHRGEVPGRRDGR